MVKVTSLKVPFNWDELLKKRQTIDYILTFQYRFESFDFKCSNRKHLHPPHVGQSVMAVNSASPPEQEHLVVTEFFFLKLLSNECHPPSLHT